MTLLTDVVTLPEAVGLLKQEHGVSVAYSSLWRRAVDQAIPAVKAQGRFYVRRQDLGVVADTVRKLVKAAQVPA
jgi:hypothetical protein